MDLNYYRAVNSREQLADIIKLENPDILEVAELLTGGDAERIKDLEKEVAQAEDVINGLRYELEAIEEFIRLTIAGAFEDIMLNASPKKRAARDALDTIRRVSETNLPAEAQERFSRAIDAVIHSERCL